jgi:hypothetical protein
LVVAAILNQSVFAMATYLRAHKQEPYLATSVVGALLLGSFTVFVGPRVGPDGLAWAHLVVTAGVGWVWGGWIFRQCRAAWHEMPAAMETR